MVKAINFGMFAPIIVPLLRALNGSNDYLGNYGWSIIALTFFINLLIFPLRHKSVVSMRKMQELQPEIKAIQDRYGKLKAPDPEKQKMNAEISPGTASGSTILVRICQRVAPSISAHSSSS